jgi:RNA polymerase sigma-70 factor (ECF subfamily)
LSHHQEAFVYDNPRRLRRPEERVGQLTNADLPPPAAHNADQDTALLAGLRARDDAAFGQLIDRYYSPMLRLATSFVRSRDEAEEVIQDTWLAVLAGIDGFQGKSSFRTWLFRILVNRARARGKREARMIPLSATAADVDSALPVFASAPVRSPEHELLGAELRAAIAAAIDGLPPEQRRVITLRDVEGWSAPEVCAALDLTPGNQRVVLHRARLHVRTALQPYLLSGRERRADCSSDLR